MTPKPTKKPTVASLERELANAYRWFDSSETKRFEAEKERDELQQTIASLCVAARAYLVSTAKEWSTKERTDLVAAVEAVTT